MSYSTQRAARRHGFGQIPPPPGAASVDPSPITPPRTATEGGAAAPPLNPRDPQSPPAAALAPDTQQRVREIPATARATRPVLQLNVVPALCGAVAVQISEDGRPVALRAQDIPGNAVGVIAFPFVRLTDAQIAQVLDGVYGGGSGGAPLLAAIAEAGATIPGSPSFIASGWMADAAAVHTSSGLVGGGPNDRSATRGTLWLAFGWQRPVTADRFMRFSKLVVTKALGFDPWGVLPPPIGSWGMPRIASGQSDTALQFAAIQSVISIMQLASALTAVFGGTMARVRATVGLVSDFVTNSQKMAAAVSVAAAAPTMLAMANQVAQAAISASPETAQAAVDAVNQVQAQLRAAKATIQAGLDAAEWMLRFAAVEQTEAGALARGIRDQVRVQTQSVIDRYIYQAAKEYMTCMYWTLAQQTLGPQINTVMNQLSDSAGTANAISTNRQALLDTMAQFDRAIANGDYAKSQAALDWYAKDFHGYPVYAWAGGGFVVLLGVGLIAKRRRARAASTSIKVSPNRRRSR